MMALITLTFLVSAWRVAAPVEAQVTTANFSRYRVSGGPCLISAGSGSPESAVTGSPCDLFLRTNGSSGTQVYVKETGTATNTGWIPITTSAGTAPIGATYITQTADGTLTNEQALSALSTGMVKVTTTTGVLSTGVAGTDYTAPGSTDTFTNKTLDTEATGNIVTVPFRFSIPAAWCQGATPISTWSWLTAAAPTPACDTGSNVQKGVLEFPDDGSTVIEAQTPLWLPADFTGAIDVRIRWVTAATSGNAVWQVSTICVADAETSDPAFNAASTVTDAAKGTTLQDNDAAITGVTATGCAAGEMLYLRLLRDPGHASDTLADTASVRGIEVTIRRAL